MRRGGLEGGSLPEQGEVTKGQVRLREGTQGCSMALPEDFADRAPSLPPPGGGGGGGLGRLRRAIFLIQLGLKARF